MNSAVWCVLLLGALVEGKPWAGKKVEHVDRVAYERNYAYNKELKKDGWYFAPQTSEERDFTVEYLNKDEHNQKEGSYSKSSAVFVDPHKTSVQKSEDGEHKNRRLAHKAHPVPYPGAYHATRYEQYQGAPWSPLPHANGHASGYGHGGYGDHGYGHGGYGHGAGYGRGYGGYGHQPDFHFGGNYGHGHRGAHDRHDHGRVHGHRGHRHGDGYGYDSHQGNRFAARGHVDHGFDVRVAHDVNTHGGVYSGGYHSDH